MFLYTEPTCNFETYTVQPESEVTLKKAEFTAFLHGLRGQYISINLSSINILIFSGNLQVYAYYLYDSRKESFSHRIFKS